MPKTEKKRDHWRMNQKVSGQTRNRAVTLAWLIPLFKYCIVFFVALHLPWIALHELPADHARITQATRSETLNFIMMSIKQAVIYVD